MRQYFAPGAGGTADRRWLVLAMLFGMMAWLGTGEASRLLAQDMKEAPAAKEAAPPQEEAPAADAGGEAPATAEGNAPAGGAAPGTTPQSPQNLLSLGDPGLRADRPVPALPLGLLHGAGDPAVHGVCGSARRSPRRWSRSSRPPSATRSSRRRTTSARTTTRSWPGWSATGIANLPNGRPEAKEAMLGGLRRDRHQHWR